VAECLQIIYAGVPPWGRFVEDGTRVLVHMSDVGGRVLLGLGRFSGHDPERDVAVDEDDIHVLDVALHGPAGAVDLTISGTAEDLDLWLWHRGSEHLLEVDGSEAVLDRLRAVLGQPID